jgi:hypothetical protein
MERKRLDELHRMAEHLAFALHDRVVGRGGFEFGFIPQRQWQRTC